MAAALLAAGLACLPQRAAASCGDYVTIAGDHGGPGTGPAGHDPRPADGRPAPCHGPNCDRTPAEPLAPPAAPVTTPHPPKQRLDGLADEPDAPRPSGYCGAPHSSGRAVRRPASVFHPPRAA